MKKNLIKILFFVSILYSLPTFAQDVSFDKLKNLSDKELLTYVESYQKKGMSLQDMITIAKTRGVSQTEIDLLLARIKNAQENSGKPNKNNPNDIENTNDDPFGYTVEEAQKKKDSLTFDDTIFGASYFKNPKISLNPSTNFATPPSYQLGPGDEVIIDLWGSASVQYKETISKEGTIYIESLGPVYLSGMSVQRASSYLTSKLSAIHSGLKKNASDEAKVFLRLGLAKSRSIVVSVVGQASVPGNFTISAFTSPLNALYAAGGPNDIGSYREIQHIRNNKVIEVIDLYDYLVNGKSSYKPLRDQDVLLIPYVKNRVIVEGPFVKEGKFEVKDGESLAALLEYNGGIKPDAYNESVSVTRFVAFNKKQLRVERKDFSSFIPKAGDVIIADAKGDYITDKVEVIGEVNIEGIYDLQEAKSVGELIKKARGITPKAIDTLAFLFRERNGVMAAMKSISLKDILDGKSDIDLQSGDRLQILSSEDLSPKETINISGYVKNPEVYPYFKGITAKELIALAGGLQYNASSSVRIYRKDLNDPNAQVKEYTDNLLTEDDDVELSPFDLVIVTNKVNLSIESVKLTGETKITGTFSLKEKYTVQQLLEDAGGFLNNADKDGIYIKRKLSDDLKNNQDVINFSNKDSLDQSALQEAKLLYLPVDLDAKQPLLLVNGDEVVVSKKKTDITILGAVQKPTVINYRKGMTVRQALDAAGGTLSSAKRSKVYVVSKNKSVKGTKSFLFFRSFPKLHEGATIYVPEKVAREKMSTQEVIGITSGVASLALLISTIFRR